MQKVKKENEVRDEDILKLAEMYRKLTPANRFFMVSASGLLLASQSNARRESGTEVGIGGGGMRDEMS